MTPSQFALVQQLASGDFVSGKVLGDVMGISRAAIWKQLQQLQVYGLAVESIKGRGYRIPGGLDLLDSSSISRELSTQSRACLARLHLEPVMDSTNSWLLRQLASGAVTPGTACVAEQQTNGKGRRGREWVSPFARNLYCSLVWEFEQGVSALEGLSLSVGVATVTALKRLNLPGVTLKWPNDLLWNNRKLGGVLLEITGEASGICQVVIGVGLNVRMSPAVAGGIDQPWVDLAEVAGAEPLVSRSRLAGVLLDELVAMLCQFQEQGFAPFREKWEALNAHAGQPVTLIMPASRISGQMLGINDQGALRLQIGDDERIFFGGRDFPAGAGVILDVDIGNSSLKWRLRNSVGFPASGKTELDNLGELARQLSRWKVKRVRVGCVAGVAAEQYFGQWCAQQLAVAPEFARVQQHYAGVSVGYSQPGALGVDRWLAMLAAYQQTGGACAVLDAGSAFTVDVINKEGRHLGGLILPGVRMMGEALFSHTHGVKVGALTLPRQWQLGRDTVSCVENGVAAALRGLVEQVVGYCETHCGKDVAFWVCGGDAEAVVALDQRLSIGPDLVLDGLALVFGDDLPSE